MSFDFSVLQASAGGGLVGRCVGFVVGKAVVVDCVGTGFRFITIEKKIQ